MSGSFRLAAAVAIGVAVGTCGVLLAQHWYAERQGTHVPSQIGAEHSEWHECGARDGWRWRDCRFAREGARPASAPMPVDAAPPAGYIEWSGDPSSRRVVPR